MPKKQKGLHLVHRPFEKVIMTTQGSKVGQCQPLRLLVQGTGNVQSNLLLSQLEASAANGSHQRKPPVRWCANGAKAKKHLNKISIEQYYNMNNSKRYQPQKRLERLYAPACFEKTKHNHSLSLASQRSRETHNGGYGQLGVGTDIF